MFFLSCQNSWTGNQKRQFLYLILWKNLVQININCSFLLYLLLVLTFPLHQNWHKIIFQTNFLTKSTGFSKCTLKFKQKQWIYPKNLWITPMVNRNYFDYIRRNLFRAILTGNQFYLKKDANKSVKTIASLV